MIDFDPGSKARSTARIGVTNLVAMTVVIAILGIVFCLVDISVGAVIFGAAGLVLGGYSMGFVRRHAGADKKLMILAGVSILLSVIAFMLGFIQIAE